MAKLLSIDWPALQNISSIANNISFQRGVFGKVHGAASDYRWIACTSQFDYQQQLELQFFLGAENQPEKMLFWRFIATDSSYYAGIAYPSRAEDAAGRSGFLEKQVAKISSNEIPAALAALILLPKINQWRDDIWWKRRKEIDWSQTHSILLIDSTNCILDTPNELAKYLQISIEKGIKDLNLESSAAARENLEYFYANLLANQTPAILYSSQALSPEALAVLLLPFPAEIANTLSIAGWWPNNNFKNADNQQSWSGIVCSDTAVKPALSVTALTKLPEAAKYVRLLLSFLTKKNESASKPSSPQFNQETIIQDNHIVIWGLSSTGKTVLLSQLYLKYFEQDNGWLVNPIDESSLKYINTIHEQNSNNFFPAATLLGNPSKLLYQFKNTNTGVEATLSTDDRAGQDYEKDFNTILDYLLSANALVLLIDPVNLTHKNSEKHLKSLFLHMLTKRSTPKDSRPVAVCISKADYLIENSLDLKQAIHEPDEFVCNRFPWLEKLINQYCTNYRFFPISAVGVNLNYGIIEHNTFYDENLTLRLKSDSKSFNLILPFSWLIDQMEVTSA